MGLKAKFSLYVTAVVSLVVLGSGAIYLWSERQLLKSELERSHQQSVLLLARVSEEAQYQNDFVLFNYFEKLQSQRAFKAAGFVNAQGIIQVHSDPAQIGKAYTPASPNTDILELTAVVNTGGSAYLLYDKKELEQFLRDSFLKTARRILLTSLVSLFFGIVGALFVAQTLVRPIEEIVLGMKNVAAGKLEPIDFAPRRDELGWMGQEINHTIVRLKELDDMKRDFVAGVTHELRSPLAAIQSFMSILMKKARAKSDADEQDLLMTVTNNATRLQKMIDDLLTTAKLEAGKTELNLNRVDLRDVVSDVVELYTPLSKEKGIALKAELPSQPVMIEADHEKLVQVVTNLVSNAFKFTDKGTIALSIAGKINHVEMVVSDTGAGIAPAEKRVRIFEKFVQGESGKEKKKGTGLGLAIVKGIVEAHHGTILVEGNTPTGSRFIIRIPK